MTYLSFIVNSNTYAVPVAYISESIQQTHITRIPRMPEYVLGVMNLRGKIVPVMDSRIRMGMKPKSAERNELLDLLQKRQSEHRSWIEQLEDEVSRGRQITVEKNPNNCAFGKWYNRYMSELDKSENNNDRVDNALLNALKAIDEPHKELHRLSSKAADLITQNREKEALELVKKAKTTEIEKLDQLFKSLYTAIDNQGKRDIIVIMQLKDDLFGITVDAIDSTLEIKELSEAPVKTDLIKYVSVVENRTVQILDLDAFTEFARSAVAK